MANSRQDGLSKAKKNQADEFYTQYSDIQKELNAYLEYNPDTFRDKTVLLPCDDPAWSKGGATDASNCQMLCKTHNRVKGNK